MTPDEYLERLDQLFAEGWDRESLDFAARFEPTVQPPLTPEQIDGVAGALEGSAMAIAMLDARAREVADAGAVTPAERLASHG